MSDLYPSKQVAHQPVRNFVLPPPPPTVLKPIPSWVWFSSVILTVGLVAGLIAIVRWSRKQSHTADTAVASLHRKMTVGDDAGIFIDADPTYRATITAQTSMNMFDTVRSRLGTPHSSRQIGSDFSNDDSMGDFVTLRYLTVFDKGSGREVICFHKSNRDWKLAAYNVESPLLQISKPGVRQK